MKENQDDQNKKDSVKNDSLRHERRHSGELVENDNLGSEDGLSNPEDLQDIDQTGQRDITHIHKKPSAAQ